MSGRVKAEFGKLMAHIRKGCLSDPPSLSLYYKIRTDSNNLPVYRCIRGTSDVESFHQLIEMRFQPWNASPEFADAVLSVIHIRQTSLVLE